MRILQAIALLFCFSLLNAQDFSDQQKIAAPDRNVNDNFGLSGAISGARVAIGAWTEDEDESPANTLTNAGSAYIYEYSDSSGLTYIRKIAASDRAADDRFGTAVDLWNDYLLITAPQKDDNLGSAVLNQGGAAYIYERNGSGNWSERAKLRPTNKDNLLQYGLSAAIWDDYAFVGVPLDKTDSAGGFIVNGAGSVYIYRRSVNGSWLDHQKITPVSRNPEADFGRSVDVEGDYLVVGAPGDLTDSTGNDSLPFSGSAFVFKKGPLNDWEEVEKLVNTDRDSFELFGSSVAISGSYIAVGSPNDEGDPADSNLLPDAGSVSIYRNDGSDNYNLQAKIYSPDRGAAEFFGNSVSLDGDLLVVGSRGDAQDANGSNSLVSAGSAFVFRREAGNNWVLLQKISAADRAASDQFGQVVDISAERILVCAPFEDENAAGLDSRNAAGSAYFFKACGLNDSLQLNGNSLQAFDDPGYLYEWWSCDTNQLPEAPISGPNGSSYDPDQNGSYAVVVRSGSCSDTSRCVAVTGIVSSIPGLVGTDLRIFPNPAGNRLEVRFSQTVKTDEIRLLDMLGRVCRTFEPLNGTRSSLDLQGLSPGNYLLQIASPDFRLQQLIRKQ